MLALYLFGTVAACVLIWKTGDWFEGATEYLGRNMSNGVKGASLNAIASSMPELLTSFIFLFFLMGDDGYAGTIGTTAGSAVFNSLLIPAAVIFVVFLGGILIKGETISLTPKVIRRDGFTLIVCELALILVIFTNEVTWHHGLALMIMYAYYAQRLYKDSKEKEEWFEHDYGSKAEAKNAWLWLTISVVIMTVTCWGLVYCVEQIGVILEVPLIFVSIILAAAASSVPDTVISIKDAKKGNYDDAISNALGSNIFDICIAHGLPLFLYTIFIGPIVMTDETSHASIELRVSLLILTIIAVALYALSKKGFTIKHAWILIGLYVIFITFIVTRAFNII